MQIVIQTLTNFGEPSAERVRVKPYPGQFELDYRVWCSTSQREAALANSLFLVDTTWVTPESRQPYLRVGLKKPWIPLTVAQAKGHVAKLAGRKLGSP
jgi:protoheme ferro-lyase